MQCDMRASYQVRQTALADGAAVEVGSVSLS
jgi:hypothetical protein